MRLWPRQVSNSLVASLTLMCLKDQPACETCLIATDADAICTTAMAGPMCRYGVVKPVEARLRKRSRNRTASVEQAARQGSVTTPGSKRGVHTAALEGDAEAAFRSRSVELADRWLAAARTRLKAGQDHARSRQDTELERQQAIAFGSAARGDPDAAAAAEAPPPPEHGDSGAFISRSDAVSGQTNAHAPLPADVGPDVQAHPSRLADAVSSDAAVSPASPPAGAAPPPAAPGAGVEAVLQAGSPPRPAPVPTPLQQGGMGPPPAALQMSRAAAPAQQQPTTEVSNADSAADPGHTSPIVDQAGSRPGMASTAHGQPLQRPSGWEALLGRRGWGQRSMREDKSGGVGVARSDTSKSFTAWRHR